MSSKVTQPDKPNWKAVQVEVPRELWPQVRSVAAAQEKPIREFVSESLAASVAAFRAGNQADS
jgi:hypothetical protein